MGADPKNNQRLRSNLQDKRSILGPGKTRLRPMLEPLRSYWKSKILSEFFDCLDASIRLFQLKGFMPCFTNLRPKIECLTDRRFAISHLSQLKFVLPKVVEITKVLVKDGITNNMKRDLRVTVNVDAVENDDKLNYEGGGHMHLRRAFRHRLGEISKSHPNGDHDMCVPFTGSEAWTRSLGYKIVDEWRPWTSNGQGSGHTVPEYKPQEAFDLFSRFLAGKPQ
ncbi:unnamed protein product [Malus baccata var. baccata]